MKRYATIAGLVVTLAVAVAAAYGVDLRPVLDAVCGAPAQ